ncbi:fgf [Adoxophyes orana granulovirus]|uniref:Fgf n=1 Tax=Adoxophyes orana granulovirus TaxID=170617 RepID=Q7T9R0_GVAO|nr:fgf [Adoxophyes orana granulovirus]AAP85742.1 fgf [Adoxophyes orana granulovirus]AJA91746.1 fibroblast growth factor 2 [Adoxophyes orana granulovirus]
MIVIQLYIILCGAVTLSRASRVDVLEHLKQKSNKIHGTPLMITFDKNLILQSDIHTGRLRSTPSNYSFSFYKHDDGSFYLRDANCNFVCLNACKEIYMSIDRIKHLCRYVVKELARDKYAFYLANKLEERSITLSFNKTTNLLEGTSDVSKRIAEFGLELSNDETRCEPTFKSDQQEQTNQCDALTYSNTLGIETPDRATAAHIKNHLLQFYQLINSPVKNKIFVKSQLSSDMFVLKSVDLNNCLYMCYTDECGLYMSEVNSVECKIKTNQINKNKFIAQFVHNKYPSKLKLQRIDHKNNIEPECRHITDNTNKISSTCNATAISNSSSIHFINWFILIIILFYWFIIISLGWLAV